MKSNHDEEDQLTEARDSIYDPRSSRLLIELSYNGVTLDSLVVEIKTCRTGKFSQAIGWSN